MGNTKGVERKKERKQRQENEKKGKQLIPNESLILENENLLEVKK